MNRFFLLEKYGKSCDYYNLNIFMTSKTITKEFLIKKSNVLGKNGLNHIFYYVSLNLTVTLSLFHLKSVAGFLHTSILFSFTWMFLTFIDLTSWYLKFSPILNNSSFLSQRTSSRLRFSNGLIIVYNISL